MPCPEDSVLRSLESYVARMGPPSLRPEDLGCLTSAAPSQYEHSYSCWVRREDPC